MTAEPALLGARIARRPVDVRLRRQRHLHESPPVDLQVVLDESLDLVPRGDPAVMKAQLEHLTGLAEMPNVVIQVLPFVAGAHPAMTGSFMVFEFPHPAADLVYVELLLPLPSAFEKLRGQALSPEESTIFLSPLADEM